MIHFRSFLKAVILCLVPYITTIHAASITWVADSSSNMNDAANWSPSTIPSSGDNAIFDSTIHHVNTNPNENTAPFSISTFTFPHRANPFNFHFNNQSLVFNGIGIIGNQTNPFIQLTNINNSLFLGTPITFLGPTSSAGSANISITNNATLTGNQSSTAFGILDSFLSSSGPFTIESNGQIFATNIGTDSTVGMGNNGTANTGSSQLRFNDSFTAGDNVAVSVSNTATFSGTNSTQGDSVCIVNGSQFLSSGAFNVGNNFNCNIQNSGNDSSLGIGLSNIGQINAAQMLLQSTATVGNNCNINISNTGTNSSQTTTFPDFIGYLNDQQLFIGNLFQAGNDLHLSVSNTGVDTSGGYGQAQVAVVNSNSGTSGQLVLFAQGCELGDRARITITNDGSYTGTNSNGGPSVGLMNLNQLTVGDITTPGAHTFNAGDHFYLNASAIGNDSGNGLGGDVIGAVSSGQVALATPCTLGDQAKIYLTNSGTFSGHNTNSFVNVGSCGGCQFNCLSSFEAGDNFELQATNEGAHSGSGIGNDFIGDIIFGQQASFQDGLTLGNNASFTISNSGTISSATTVGSLVGSINSYGKQLWIKDTFHAGNNLYVSITNSGFDESTGTGGNYAGFINNNTADHTASQFHLDATSTVGHRASILLSNTGTYEGYNTGTSDLVGVLAGQQFYAVSNFNADDDFTLTASNSGIDNASNQNSHGIGTVAEDQVKFGAACTLGDRASIVVTNSGINHDTTGTYNTIGFVGGDQIRMDGPLSIGNHLHLEAINTALNEGDLSNLVGSVGGSQISFGQQCDLKNDTLIRAFNSGFVTNSQILFLQGFDVTDGQVTIQAINEGTIGSFGINIAGSSLGGNAHIELQNSSMYIESSSASFTIATLKGDNTSSVQSLPSLIIHPDSNIQAEFSGIIQDFPSETSTLVKSGSGTQILSGFNTYTGLTTIQEGNLVINGSVAGDVLINPLGLLKGTGIIGGNLTNAGNLAPGQSIGTIPVLGNYINNNGTYDVEVNGQGQSDLLDVSGTATLNGGIVTVSSVDGGFRFQQPYTIVTAVEGVSGTYTGAISSAFINPILDYDPNNVYLIIQSALFNAAEAYNQFGVASNLDAIFNPNTSQSLLISAIANLPLKEAQEALESLSGFQYTQDVWMTEIATRRFLRRLYNPLRKIVSCCDNCCPCSYEGSECISWFEVNDGYTKVYDKNAHHLSANSYELSAGVQKTFCNNLTFGLAGSYEYDHVRYRDGHARRNSEFFALYGLYRPCLFYGLFDLVYGHTTNKVKRSLHAGRLEYQAHSKPDLDAFTFYGEVGVDLQIPCFFIQPFIGLQAGQSKRGHFRENCANGFGLSIHKHDWSSVISRLGLHVSTCHLCDCIETSLDLAWNQRLSSAKNSTVGQFRDFGTPFRICGNRLDRSSFDYALNLAASLSSGCRGYLEVGGEWWQHANTFNVSGGIEFAW